MRFLKAVGRLIWRFMVVFSFIVNIVLVLVIVGLVLFLPDINRNVIQPLVGGLYSSFVGLDDATIDWTIPVRDRIPVELDIPLETNTTVVLTEPVPLSVTAQIDLPGINAFGVNANVDLTLPVGLELPVALNLNVPVDEQLDIALDVRAVIPLQETQLHDPLANLQLLFEPIVIALYEAPQDLESAVQLIGGVLRGEPLPNLLQADNPDNLVFEPWPGFSLTAGLNYDLLTEPFPPDNVPVITGFVPQGGIPLLDQETRPHLYADGNTPESLNEAARQNLEAQGVPPHVYDGTMGEYFQSVQQAEQVGAQAATPTHRTQQPDFGIVPPPETDQP